MTNFEKAARTALKGLAASGDFLFNWHDCDPDNAAEMQAYATALAAVTTATIALEEALDALAQEPAGQLMEQAYGRGQVLWFNKPPDLSMLYTSPPAQKQEPFGHVTVRRLSQRFENHHDQYHFYPVGQSPYLDNVDECHAVYTSPPSKPWVDLTQEEVEQLCVPLGAAMLSFAEVARVVAAKLKEKNT